MSRLATLALLLLAACGSQSSFVDRDQSEAMLAVCRIQEAAWNRGDLEAFMSEGYLRSGELTFFSGGDVSRGFETVLDRYRRRYKSEGAAMGKLTFDGLETLLLSPGAGIVRGRWRLDHQDGARAEGLFTLVMRRIDGAWRIVHDHTSVATPR